jgi:hypothetical protein
VKEPREAGGDEGNERHGNKGVRDAAMMLELLNRAGESPEDIEIRRFGRERSRQSRVRGFPIETGAADTCASKKVRDGLHGSLVPW